MNKLDLCLLRLGFAPILGIYCIWDFQMTSYSIKILRFLRLLTKINRLGIVDFMFDLCKNVFIKTQKYLCTREHIHMNWFLSVLCEVC